MTVLLSIIPSNPLQTSAMSENKDSSFNLDLTDDEFVALHAAASAKGVHVNDFIVATLRQHTLLAKDIEAEQRESAALEGGEAAVPSPS
jgi:uncharacterized protein (DUF1778 family)